MKKELVLSVLIVLVVAGGILINTQKKSAPGITPSAPSTATISKENIAKHSSKDDCWVVVNGNVYNVTSYIPNHPGGPQQIIPLCGGDAITAFDTKGGQGQHSLRAQTTLDTLLVGALQK